VLWPLKRCICAQLICTIRVTKVACDIEISILYLVHLRLVEPFNALTVLPEAEFLCLFIAVCVDAKSVLLAMCPPPFILAPIRPVVDSVTIFFVALVLTVVSHAICVDINSVALHIVLAPLPEVLPPILPQVRSVPVDLVVHPLSRVR